MKTTVVLLTLAIVCLINETAVANTDSKTNSSAHNYLKLLTKNWKRPLSKYAKTKKGRSILRNYVAKVRLAYARALAEYNNDPLQLNNVLQENWNSRMFNRFRHPLHVETALSKEFRKLAMRILPYEPRHSQFQGYPYDPYVDDPSFFQRLFNLRTSWRSFQVDPDLARVFERYRELWMERYTRSKLLMSEVIYLWAEARMERIVSLVSEWEIAEIGTDENDTYPNELSFDKVPADLSNSVDDDHLYNMRMFHYDHAGNNHLFYGLPYGTRQVNEVPSLEVDYIEAESKLESVVERLNEYKGGRGMADLAEAANQFLRAYQRAMNVSSSHGELYCSKDSKACHISECAEIEMYMMNPKGKTSRIESLDGDSGIFSAGSTSPRRFNLDPRQLEMFLEDELGTSSARSENITGTGTNWYAFNELLNSCVDNSLRDSNRSKRDLLSIPQALRQEKVLDCKKSIDQRVKTCLAKLREPVVKDPMTLVRSFSKVVKNNENLNLSCDDQVLVVVDSVVFVSSPVSGVITSLEYALVPALAFDKNKNDISSKSLSAIKKKCNGKVKCSIDVDIEKMSGHTSKLDLSFNVTYQCAPYGCNPNLYAEKTTSADENEALNWQCKNDIEGILITSVDWKRKDGFFEDVKTIAEFGVSLAAFNYNDDDMDLKFSEYLKKNCNGKNKCDQSAALEAVTGHSTDYEVYIEVKYKCLPCNEFYWKV